MDITIAEMDRLIDEVKARSEEPGDHLYFYISPSMYRSVQMAAQGKRFYRGKPHKRKSPMRQPRAIRQIRLQHIKHTGTIHGMKFFFETMGG